MKDLSELTEKLVMYNGAASGTILAGVAESLASRDEKKLTGEIHTLLEVATRYGFKDNLWKSYIAYLLATDENPFSVLCEMVGAAKDAGANVIVKKDMDCFYHIYNYDFSSTEDDFAREYFSILCD